MTKITSIVLFLVFCFTASVSEAAKYKIDHLEPSSWWVGMTNPKLQLMVHGKNISDLKPQIDYPGVKLNSSVSIENPNYLFVNLIIDENAKPGKFKIDFQKNNKTQVSFEYELKQRKKDARIVNSYNTSDIIYLITPDRFANGDKSNDYFEELGDPINRKEPYGRHGGDLRGIINHLDYIDEMGFTSIWLNPVIENHMPESSYHGYAITDFYKTDPRFGTNEEYLELAEKMDKRGMKLIMDMIMNHCGAEHWWMKDMPSKDWINFEGKFKVTNHRKTLVQDPYGSDIDKKIFEDGWFVSAMPDLNQRNPFMATYLIQNTIWWIEYLGLDGIRMDTYPYPNKEFMTVWSKAVTDEYPGFNIVGEEWSNNPAIVAHWQKGKTNPNGYVSNLPSVFDFPLQKALVDGLNEKETWGTGIIKLYEALAMDFQYADPFNLIIFPDNHDMSRIYTQLNENYELYRLAMTYILTARGIPQIYYGTEILMHNRGTESHGVIRTDFPGGWEGDATNAFTGENLEPKAVAAQHFVKRLQNWRKTATAIHYGNTKHYVPENGVYVFFRYTNDKKVMVILNKSDKEVKLKTDRFYEVLSKGEKAKEIIMKKDITIGEEISILPFAPMILDFN